jgi:hypothetical protein
VGLATAGFAGEENAGAAHKQGQRLVLGHAVTTIRSGGCGKGPSG